MSERPRAGVAILPLKVRGIRKPLTPLCSPKRGLPLTLKQRLQVYIWSDLFLVTCCVSRTWFVRHAYAV